MARIDPETDPAERWAIISRTVLEPTDPFPIHRELFRNNYRDWDRARGPEPAVLPTAETLSESNLGIWLRELRMETYAELHAFSLSQPDRFLAAVIERLRISFETAPQALLDLSDGVETPHWFRGARLNIVDSILDADPERRAIVSQRSGNALETWSLGKLKAMSGRVANGLIDLGLKQGDAVGIDMPMTPLAVAIYLGIVRAGMSVASIADSFAAPEISTRLRIAGARAVFTTDLIVRGHQKLPLYERVREATSVGAIVVAAEERLQVELRSQDHAFDDLLSAREEFDSRPCDPEDAINILFSSGTTGEPKAIPWDHTTPVRCALDGLVHQDIHEGDVVAWPTNLGWMMGPWLIFATLMNDGTMALYEGMPQTRAFGEFVRDAEVTVLGVVPSLVRAWKTTGCMEGLDWTRIKAFSSTGESSSSEEMLFLMAMAGYKPVIEYCGGTEIGGAYLSSTPIEPNSPACFSARTLGMDSVILDEDARPSATGELFLVPPAIGLSTRLLNKDHHAVYFEGVPRHDGKILRRHGDEVEALPGGYFRAHGRTDDTMNLGGIKVSSVELERTLNRVGGVRETAAIAVSPEGGGPSELVVYAVVEDSRWKDTNTLRDELQQAIRSHLNPLFKIRDVVTTDRLPRTASNKVMRRVLRSSYERKG